MHRAYGAQQPALRVMEGLQKRHSRPERIYQAPTEETSQQTLEAFASTWDSHYPQVSRNWQAN